MKKLYTLPLILLLAACASANSQTPHITQQELAREQAEQRKIIEAEGNKKEVDAKATPAMQQRLARVAKSVHSAGVGVCKDIGARSCSFPFALDTEKAPEAVNAFTDGKKVYVSPAMMNFANTDDQLATVLSHEYAHAIMAHPSKTGQNATVGSLLGLAVDTLAGSQGVNTGGAFSKLGAQGAILRYSQGFEKEADYIGMYILKRAGYNIDNASQLWRRMAALNPDGIYVGSTHPTTAERYILLEKTASEIKAKQKAGQKLLHAFKPKDE